MNSRSPRISGVFSAAATPIGRNLSPDLDLFKAHCRRLIEEGCDGLAVLGTTGEANSFSRDERRQILEAALEAGLKPGQLIPGTGTPAIPDTVALTKDALALGINRVLMLPPFYYKGVSDDGLFAAYAEIIERIGDARLQVLLYHIPPMSAVPLSIPLIERLAAAYPDTVVGIKDSGGDIANMKAVLAAVPGFAVLSGADPLMLPLLEAGGAGCITATSNLIAGELRTVFDHFADPERKVEVAAAQERITAWRTLANRFPQIPTVKVMLALRTGEPAWRNVRPPLTPLDDAQLEELKAAMAALG
ncbi:dihydrodipicolinate synthase family protein [Chelativorans alearense]|uniref:dihydrodipicolinate synthase family protein n=1 Tax=Chelativorans alearense TaxID=2681495 RepID=UPI0013D0E040|nr:dihydrodipicolinate synthase family protein [Chelativorans alearense]